MAISRDVLEKNRSGMVTLVGVYTVTLVLSAILLFIIQPMFSKMILPLLGGAPAVWNTAMMFFQAVLLAGYSYAHLLNKMVPGRRQAIIHLVVLALGLAVLPVSPFSDWAPPKDGTPILWLIGIFALSVGAPFFAASANAPLLQSWFSRSRHPSAADPYFLYAASNVGSISALIAYPVLIEPSLGLQWQSELWSIAYGLLLIGVGICGLLVFRSGREMQAEKPSVRSIGGPETLPWSRRLHWLVLAFVPSSLLLGVTNHLTTDIAAAPFMWVLPLILYLLSFVIVFSRRPILKQSWMIKIQPYLIVFVAVTLWATSKNWLPFLILHLLTFFVCAMVCHGELARLRPSASNLTTFYMIMSLGGLLGGVFNAVIAPNLFDFVFEYPFALVLACLLRPATKSQIIEKWKADLFLPVFLVTVIAGGIVFIGLEIKEHGLMAMLLVIVVFAVMLFSFRNRALRFGVGAAATVVALSISFGPQDILTRKRSFFGIHWVQSAEAGAINLLWNGTTLHGAQFTDNERAREPLGYYYREGPFGQIFSGLEKQPNLQRVGVIGLGAGSLACYRTKGQHWTFFEIDPHVAFLAQSSGHFRYLNDCAKSSPIVLGDARLSLRSVPRSSFGVLIVDAFSSDAIPVHLLTREAIELYLSKLRPDGILVFHISNRHLDLTPVLATLAKDAGLAAHVQLFTKLDSSQRRDMKFETQVAILARDQQHLVQIISTGSWESLQGKERGSIWTDDYSNLFEILKTNWR